MSLLDVILSIIAPHICVNCGSEGRLLCGRCVGMLKSVPQSCYRCLREAQNNICSDCSPHSPLEQVHSVSAYSDIAKELVWRLKYNGAQAAAKEMAAMIAACIPSQAEDYVVSPVPTASGRVRQRGYDQAVLIAREICNLTGWQYKKILVRHSQIHQVGASRELRLKQVEGILYAKHSSKMPGKILLIDDVLTTGSTLEAAAIALKSAGAKSIDAAVFARA